MSYSTIGDGRVNIMSKSQFDDKEIPNDYNAIATPTIDGRSVPSEYRSLPETQNLYWNDDFFDNDDGVVAVFDFDYDLMYGFHLQLGILAQAIAFIIGLLIFLGHCLAYRFPIQFALVNLLFLLFQYLFIYLPLLICYLPKNKRWHVEANHLAITRDGIRFVKDKRKSWFGLSMCDKGKQSKTVPFDKITDCMVVEPAGNFCYLIPRVLFTVKVETASSGSGDSGIKMPALIIDGLKDPYRFKALVWAMKRAYGQPRTMLPINSGYQAPIPVQMEMKDRGKAEALETVLPLVVGNSINGNDITNLLTEIRDDLHKNNQKLKDMQGSTNVEPTPALATVPGPVTAVLDGQQVSNQTKPV